MNKILTVFCFLLIMLPLFSAETDSLKTKQESELLILPFGFYTNETSVALGIFSQYRFHDNNQIFGNAVYTFNNQLMFFSITEINSATISFYDAFKIKVYYSEFYGFGNNTEKDDSFSYKYFQVDNYFEAGKNILSNTRVSLALNNFFHNPKNKMDLFGYDLSEKNQFANGIGASCRFLKITDNFYRDGVNIKSSFLFYPEFFGNTGQFSIFDSEAGLFKSFNQSALNTLLSARFSFGDVHPEKLSAVGGTKILRGYPDKRFTDKNLLSLQTQYDFRIYREFALCVFLAAGDVFGEFSDMSISKAKIGYGGGIIYEFRKLVMRVEAATSLEKNLEIIITGNRAF